MVANINGFSVGCGTDNDFNIKTESKLAVS